MSVPGDLLSVSVEVICQYPVSWRAEKARKTPLAGKDWPDPVSPTQTPRMKNEQRAPQHPRHPQTTQCIDAQTRCRSVKEHGSLKATTSSLYALKSKQDPVPTGGENMPKLSILPKGETGH